MTKSVVVVEDDRGLREQIVAILRTAPDIKCIGAYATGEEALAKIPAQNPDVVLMDIRLPGMSGIECVGQLKKLNSAPQIIMVTVYEDTDRIFKALKAGANGYLVKSSPPDELLDAVRDVDTGGAPMSSHIACKVVEHFHVQEPDDHEKNNISQREQQVLTLLASGFIYKEIGDQLGIGVETVRSHVKNICQKMHVRNRVEAVAKHQARIN
ncbi:MAG TPA: response regulator transcription factor [Verrucomicrobiae bacterium]|jgi:DNA-binding NarL/FixJ family response regulator|nr:response regulator transcription factor [Verrucomicrobiae bacterium]